MRKLYLSNNSSKNSGTISDLSSEIFNLVKKIKKQFEQFERNLFRIHGISGLTPPQFFILRILWKEDGFPLKYFAKAAHCSRPTMTGIINTMKKDGLITREQNPNDGRSTLIRLTKKGKELQQYKPPLDQNPTDFFKDFKPEEIKQLSQLLKKLSNSMET